jgi:hypothetical protein
MISWNTLTVRVMMPFLKCFGCGRLYPINVNELSGRRLVESPNIGQTHKLADFDEQLFLKGNYIHKYSEVRK